jgi:hypothetical protein
MPKRREYTGYLESRLQDWATWCARSHDHGLGYPKVISAFKLWRSPQVWQYPEFRAVVDAVQAQQVQDIIGGMAQTPETEVEAAVITYWYVGHWSVRRIMGELGMGSVRAFYERLDGGRGWIERRLRDLSRK